MATLQHKAAKWGGGEDDRFLTLASNNSQMVWPFCNRLVALHPAYGPY